ncbi:MAG: hypothetical protein WC916_05125 [Candidatus Woesearchaeota archaeon]
MSSTIPASKNKDLQQIVENYSNRSIPIGVKEERLATPVGVFVAGAAIGAVACIIYQAADSLISNIPGDGLKIYGNNIFKNILGVETQHYDLIPGMGWENTYDVVAPAQWMKDVFGFSNTVKNKGWDYISTLHGTTSPLLEQIGLVVVRGLTKIGIPIGIGAALALPTYLINRPFEKRKIRKQKAKLEEAVNSPTFITYLTQFEAKKIGEKDLSKLTTYEKDIILLDDFQKKIIFEGDTKKINQTISKTDACFTSLKYGAVVLRDMVLDKLREKDSKELYLLEKAIDKNSKTAEWIYSTPSITNKIKDCALEQYRTNQIPLDDIVQLYTRLSAEGGTSVDELIMPFFSNPTQVTKENCDKIKNSLSATTNKNSVADFGVILFNYAKEIKDMALVDTACGYMHTGTGAVYTAILKGKVIPFYVDNEEVGRSMKLINQL